MYLSRNRDHFDHECNGPRDQCEGCDLCTEDVSRTKTVIARKARGQIRPGDLVRVTTGFLYQKNGPRLGYYKREYIAGYGPQHGPETMGKGAWQSHGGFAKVHPQYAHILDARESAQAEADAQVKAEAQRLKAERDLVKLAPAGSSVPYQGQEWTLGEPYVKASYHSNAEYYGHLCDATVYTYRTLTAPDGKTTTFRF